MHSRPPMAQLPVPRPNIGRLGPFLRGAASRSVPCPRTLPALGRTGSLEHHVSTDDALDRTQATDLLPFSPPRPRRMCGHVRSHGVGPAHRLDRGRERVRPSYRIRRGRDRDGGGERPVGRARRAVVRIARRWTPIDLRRDAARWHAGARHLALRVHARSRRGARRMARRAHRGVGPHGRDYGRVARTAAFVQRVHASVSAAV